MPNFVAVNLFRGFDRIGLESAFLVLNSTFLFFGLRKYWWDGRFCSDCLEYDFFYLFWILLYLLGRMESWVIVVGLFGSFDRLLCYNSYL